MELVATERKASIDQNAKMFNLVTEVQTNQITQLEGISNVLKEISTTVTQTRTDLAVEGHDIRNLEEKISHVDLSTNEVKQVLTEILDYVKESDRCNKEILNKVKFLESYMQKISPNIVHVLASDK